MSFFDDASLAFLPSGGAGKDGKAYSIKPTDGTGDFTFLRGSNLAATRVGPTGLIEKGRENLLLQSNNFDATWVNANSTNTSGQSGYDGSSDAWLLSKTGASGRITQTKSISGVFTFSVYVKKDTTDWILLYKIGTGEGGRYFDLTNGVIGSSVATAPIDANIEDVGNGWYRCSIIGNSATAVVIYVADSNGSASGTSGSIYIQSAQLEIGLVATEVITSGATTGKAGLLENEPRFDYSGGATCPSLLLEGSRTNLIGYSEYFGDSYWTKSGSSVVSGFTSPEGLSNAYNLIEDTSLGQHKVDPQNLSLTSGTLYTSSVFAKKGSRDILQMVWSGVFAADRVNFDLTNGTTYGGSSATGKIESFGNGWYRCSITQAASATGLGRCQILLQDSLSASRFASYQGNGSGNINIWGAQVEQGSYPTSYIPTYGTSQTRAQDLCTATSVSNLIGQTQGTIFIDVNISDNLDTSNIRGIFDMNDGGTNNRISIYRGANDLNIYAVIFDSGTNQASFVAYNTTGNVKIALAYNSLGVVFYINGSLVDTDSSVTVPSCSEIDLGIITNRADRILGGGINQALLFKTRLSDLDLAILTGATTYETFDEMALALNYTVYE